MSEKKLESIIRDYIEAFVKGDVEKTLSFFTEDAVWVAWPDGIFKGKDELKRLLTWSVQTTPEKKFRDAGIGIIVKGNKVIYEHVEEGVTRDGGKWEVPVICVYEFSGEKIQQHRAFYDRLSFIKQVAKGAVAQRVVSSFVKRWEKGLQ